MTRKRAVRWRRLVNRACKAYRYNVANRSRFKRQMHASVLENRGMSRLWAEGWGTFSVERWL